MTGSSLVRSYRRFRVDDVGVIPVHMHGVYLASWLARQSGHLEVTLVANLVHVCNLGEGELDQSR